MTKFNRASVLDRRLAALPRGSHAGAPLAFEGRAARWLQFEMLLGLRLQSGFSLLDRRAEGRGRFCRHLVLLGLACLAVAALLTLGHLFSPLLKPILRQMGRVSQSGH